MFASLIWMSNRSLASPSLILISQYSSSWLVATSYNWRTTCFGQFLCLLINDTLPGLPYFAFLYMHDACQPQSKEFPARIPKSRSQKKGTIMGSATHVAQHAIPPFGIPLYDSRTSLNLLRAWLGILYSGETTWYPTLRLYGIPYDVIL